VKYTEQDVFEEALEHLQLLTQHRQRGGFEDQLVVDAICMRLLAAIDTLSRLPDDRRADLFGGNWLAMRGMRNRLAHTYGNINFGIIAATVEENVPQVVAILSRELGE
jgi:uncharacterized protein with HEPN domain